MKKLNDKSDKSRGPFLWPWEDIHSPTPDRPLAIGLLPRATRQALNQRLAAGENCQTLAEWLKGLSEQPRGGTRLGGRARITARSVAQWKRGGFRQWRRRRETGSKVARHCLGWGERPEVQKKVFGEPLTNLQLCNRYRTIFGMTLLRREDFTPEELECWDYVPTRQERREAVYESLGFGPEGPGGPPLADEEESEFEDEPCPAPAEKGVYVI